MGTLTNLTIQYLSERAKRGEINAKTRKGMRYSLGTLDRSFGDRPLNQLTRRAIERWLETVGHLAPATRRNHLSACRGFCAWLTDRGLVGQDPTEKVPGIKQPRSVPRAMPRADVARLLLVCPDLRARVIVMLMVGCGLRCVEVSRLTVPDYDPVARIVTVVGKGMHERELPVPSEVAVELDRYLSTVGVIAGPLIRSLDGRSNGLSACTISTYVSRWMAAAGLKVGRWDGRSAHALRHTAASDVLDQCGDLRVVQEMLGHAQLSTTSIYLRRANLGQMREAMEGREYLRAA